MRKFTLTILLTAALAEGLTARAQTAPVGGRPTPIPPATTQEEYNYATKGLQVQRANGLDMKAGYVLSNPQTMPIGRYTIQIEDLVRTSNGTVACTLVEVSDNPAIPQGGTAYFCIPNPGSLGDIWAQFNQALRRVNSPAFLQAFAYCLAGRASAMTTATMLALPKP